MKKIFTKLLLLLMVIIFSFTFISCKKRNLGTYYEIKYEVNNQEYAKYFVEEGKLATAIVAPKVEGKEFQFWMLNNSEYDFTKAVNSNLTLVASYKDEEADGEISSAVKKQLEKIVAGAEYSKVSIVATENLKAEYKATKEGKEVSIYYLEKANNFTTVKLYVGIDETGKIVNMVTTQSDTIGKGDSFNGASMGINGATSTTIDDSFIAVSGATISSNTVKDLIHIAFNKFINDNPDLFPVETLTVTFDSNGGTLVKEIEVKSGSIFVRPNDPTRSLYHFVGWYLNDQPYDFTKPVTSNIT